MAQIGIRRTAALVAGAAAVGALLAASGGTALAKPKKKPFKVHFAFEATTTDGPVSYADPPKPRRGDAPPSLYGATINDVPVWVVSSSVNTKTGYRNASVAIPQDDYASLSYPVQIQALSAQYGTGTTGSNPQVTGYWGIGSGGAVSVTLTSYDKKHRRLSGSFSGVLKDGATFLDLPDLEIATGTFGIVLPKRR